MIGVMDVVVDQRVDPLRDELLRDVPLWDTACDEAAWQALLEEPRSLLGADPEGLSADGVLDLLVEVQREQSRLAAVEARAMVALAGPHDRVREVTVLDSGDDRERVLLLVDEAREEISAALNRSPDAVYDQIITGRLLAGPLRATGRALAAGRITAAHARALADQARRLTGAVTAVHADPGQDTPAQRAERAAFQAACDALERRALAWADALPLGRFRSRVRRLVETIDAAGQDRRRRLAQHAIDVTLLPDQDGLALLLARLPVEDAVRLKAAVDTLASAQPADAAQPIGHRRARALLDAVCGTGATVAVTAEIQVVVDLATLAALADDAGTITGAGRAPEPISATAIRELLTDPDCPATLRRLVVDPLSSHLLDRGRRSYPVTDAMRAFLITRDQTCRFPGCTRAAHRCQIDHATAWDDGGGTDRANLGPLCTRHHQLKTHTDWDLTHSAEDGTAAWRSPTGRHYTTRPVPLIDRE
jgi:hypothetical protein